MLKQWIISFIIEKKRKLADKSSDRFSGNNIMKTI